MKYTDPGGVCIVSGIHGVDLHHVCAKGMGGNHDPILDEPGNLMPLAHPLHQELHVIGLKKFADKYPEAEEWLLDNGWEPGLKKWTHARYRRF